MKRSSKIVLATLFGLGLVSVVTAKQFDYCDRGHFAEGHRAEWVMKRISHRLDLTEQQQLELRELRDSLLLRFDDMRGQRQIMHDELQSLLNNEFDQLKAQQLVEQRVARISENAPELISAFAGFYDQLDSKQQAQLRKTLEKRMMKHQKHQKQDWRHEGGENN